MKYVLTLFCLGLTCLTEAQDTLSGYISRVSGETMAYTSYTPMASQAMLVRSNTGQMSMEWITEKVPQNFHGDTVYFTWVGGNASGTLAIDATFDFFIEGVQALTVVVNKNFQAPGWYFSNPQGVSLRFQKLALDPSNDESGRVTLAVPKSMITPGKPLHLSFTGQKRSTQDWLMVYQYRISDQFMVEALPLLKKSASGDTLRMLRIYGAYKKNAGTLHVQAGQLVHDFVLHQDYNELEWGVPYHSRDRRLRVVMSMDGKSLPPDTLALSPLQPLEIHLVAHSHTDIGYSNLQPQVAAIQIDNIRKAIGLIKATKDYPNEARFRWNIESLWAVENFLDSASVDEVKSFAEALATGRMTLQAFYANELTGLLDGEELIWLTAYARRMEDRFHVKIRSAMITDVPGYTWSTIQAMHAAGIRYFSIGPNNSDRIGGVLSTWGDKPFYWSVPGGGRVLVDVAGSSYSWFHGTTGSGDPVRLTQRLLGYVRHLNEEGYPYRHALVRYNIVSDNAPLDTGISGFVRNWNDQYLYPRLVLSTPEMTLSAIEKDYGSKLPVLRGDMSPYWEDGAASTAMELGWNRRLRAGLEQTEALAPLVGAGLDDEGDAVYRAWRGVVMFDEHTWGAWSSITDPDNPFTVYQWRFKRGFLEEGDSLARSLRASLIKMDPSQGVAYHVVNTHSWEVSAQVEIPHVKPEEVVFVSGGKVPLQQPLSNGDRLVQVEHIPGFGSVALRTDQSADAGTSGGSGVTLNGYQFENTFLRLRIDSANGGIASLVVKRGDGQELVDAGPYVLNQYEYVPGRDPSKALGARLLKLQVAENGPLLTVIKIGAEAPGARALKIEYRINNLDGSITIVDSIDKEEVRTKEAVHFAFPFSIAGAHLLADNGAFPYRPFEDTLAGGNRDFGYVGKWMDLSSSTAGVLLCPLDAPIMEWGAMRSEVIAPGSSVSAWKKTFTPTQTYFSYAMNNYWHTNYKADQAGWASFTYKLFPHGAEDKAALYKISEEAEAAPILLSGGQPLLKGPYVHLGNPETAVSTIVRVPGTGWWLQVYNPTDKPLRTTVTAVRRTVYTSNIHQDRLSPVGSRPIAIEPYTRVSFLLVDER